MATFESSKYWLSGMLAGVAKVKTTKEAVIRAFIGAFGYGTVFTVFSWLLAKKRDA